MAKSAGEKQREIAQRAGFPTYYAYRKARAREQGYSGVWEQRRRRAAGDRLPSDPGRANQGRVKAGRRQVFDTAAGTVVKTTTGGKGYGVLEAQIRNADVDALVTMTVDVRTGSGDVVRVSVYGHGGIRAHVLAGLIEDAGGIGEFLAGGASGKSGAVTTFEVGDIVAIQVVIA